MGRYVRLYKLLFKQYFKVLVEYRTSFVFGIGAFLIDQIGGLTILIITFSLVPIIEGFNFYELLLIYGLFQIPKGIDHLFTDRLWNVPRMVIKGEVDKYFLKPISPLFYIATEKFQPDALGEIVVGISVIIYTLPKVDIIITPITVIAVIIMTLFGVTVFTMAKIAGASISFYIKDSFPILQGLYNMSEFGKYPITIFPSFMKLISVYILPYAFTAYYPIAYLLGRESLGEITWKYAIGFMVLLFLSSLLWRNGIKNYESAGS